VKNVVDLISESGVRNFVVILSNIATITKYYISNINIM